MIALRICAIVITMLCSLFLFGINSSYAQINITDMSTPSETYNNGHFYHYAYIETDKPYGVVDWYIGDPDTGHNLQYKGETQGNGVTTRAWFYPDVSDCPGHVKGKKYRVAAKVWYYDDDNNSWSDYESRDFVVFKSIFTTEVDEPPKKMRSIYGYSELARQYFTGDAIKIDCYVFAFNPYETDRRTWSRFKHSLTGRLAIEKDHPVDSLGIAPQRIGGKYGSYSRFGTLSHYDVDVNTDEYISGAYVKLIVEGNGIDVYFVENTETFNSKDKPYDAPDE